MRCTAVYDLLLNVTDLSCKQSELTDVQDRGPSAKVDVAETVAFRFGRYEGWWNVSKKGHVRKRGRPKNIPAALCKAFLKKENYETVPYVAIFRFDTDRPLLLNAKEMEAKINALDEERDVFECFERCKSIAFEAYSEPSEDSRFVTSYLNTGQGITFHTFQQAFSKRYLPVSVPIPKDKTPDLGSALLEYQKQHKRDYVDASTKIEFKTLTHSIVKHIQKAHGIVLRGLTCEYIRDPSGTPILLSFLRIDVISDHNGNGSGSCFSAAFSQQSEDLSKVLVKDLCPKKDILQHSTSSDQTNLRNSSGTRSESLSLDKLFSEHMQTTTPQRDSGSLTWRPPTNRARVSIKPRASSAIQANPNSTTEGTPNLRTAHRSLRRPHFVSQLNEEVESLRTELISKDQSLQSIQHKINALEQEKEIAALSFKECFSNKQSELEQLREDVSSLRKEKDALSQKLKYFEEENSRLEANLTKTQSLLSEERETALHTIREYQVREQQHKNQMEQLQKELDTLTQNLREELATSSAFKKHLVSLHEREKPAEILCDDLDNVLELVYSLWSEQGNPKGERYAIARVLQTYEEDTRSVFLYYCQLEESCMKYWPPRMSSLSWVTFCKDAEISDPRAGARIRSNKHSLMIPVVEIQKLFFDFGVRESDAETKLLAFEGFLACLISCSEKLSSLPFLSECLRDFIGRYVLKAQKSQSLDHSNKKKTTKKQKQTRSLSSRSLRT